MRNITETGVHARLNLGCGTDVKVGYLNVDTRRTHPTVVEVDLSKMPWPFADRSAAEILMLDFLEHFPYRMTPRILLEVHRVLDTDGEVTIQVPDALHTARALIDEGGYLCNRCGGDMSARGLERCPGCGQSRDDISEAAMQRFYGGQDYEGNFHHTCFTERSLERKAAMAGLIRTSYNDDDLMHYWKNWTLCMRFRKGSVW